MRFAFGDRLLLAVSLGGALTVGVLFGLRSLGLGFGLCSGFALGVSVGRLITGNMSVHVLIAIEVGIHTRRCSSELQRSQG